MNVKVRRMGRIGVAVIAIATLWIAGQMPSVLALRSIREIEQEQQELQEEIDALDSELMGLVSEIAALESEISAKRTEIAETEQQLASAQEAVDRQYEAMKIRIRYMYENENQSMLAILLESGSISDFLNRLEYVSAVYTYDRTLLDEYEAAKREIEDLKAGLEEEKAALEGSRREMSARKADLNRMISSKKGKKADINKELDAAKKLAARQEELRRQQQQQAASGNGGGSGGGNNSGGANTSASSSNNVNGDLNPAPTKGISGSAVVAYANQFVGNPYKWGGTDLNNGADCSGFIISVYDHFGIHFGRITSYEFRSVGKEVSYKNMQPGDIVCYSGHVAIYAGGGKIVEAQSATTGITNNRSVNSRSIITIRRVL